MGSQFRHINPCPSRGLSRRGFLSTLGRVAGGAVVASAIGAPVTAGLRQTRSTVAMARIGTYDRSAIRSTLEAMLDDLGGLGDVVRPGDTVGIKINLTGGSYWANPYEATTGLPVGETIWTHPEILRAVAELIRDAGAGSIYILEALYDPQSYHGFGYAEAASNAGATLIDLNQTAPYGSFAVRPVGNQASVYSSFIQSGIFGDLDVLVSLAKSKEHVGAGITHGMKNLVGALPLLPQYTNGAGHRSALHSNQSLDGNSFSNLCRIILDLNLASPIRLVINDLIQTVSGGEGPWLDIAPLTLNTLIASKDPVAADAIATRVMGFDPTAAALTAPFSKSLNYLARAEELGMGIHDPSAIDLVETPLTHRASEQPASGGPSISAFPNPFVERTSVLVTIAKAASTRLSVFDITGKPLQTMYEGHLHAGTHRFEWDGRTRSGDRVTSGVYVIAVEAGTTRRSTRVVALGRE